MKKMQDVLLLCGDTTRTKAYLQAMEKAGYLPGRCLIMTEDYTSLEAEADARMGIRDNEPYFDAAAPLLRMLREADISYDFLPVRDVNSAIVAEVLRATYEPYVIYSGYGGYILKPHLFQLGKRFLHVHAGLLPHYRGSTTAYYSILKEGFIGASAIFLEEKLDAGCILYAEQFPLPPANVDIDYIYEPYVRSQVLVQVLKQYAERGSFAAHAQPQAKAETYYIIHPVLKHLAMLKVAMRGVSK